MIPSLITTVVVLVALVAALLWNLSHSKGEMEWLNADRARLENSIRHNVRAIRSRVGYGFPEAVATCDALESALQARCKADVEGLENRLIRLRVIHNANVINGREPAPAAPRAEV